MGPRSMRRMRAVLMVLTLVTAGAATLILISPFDSSPDSRRGGNWDIARKARDALAKGRPDLALKATARIREKDEGAGEAMAQAGYAFVSLKKLPEARRALERSLEVQPQQPMATKVLAAIYLSTGDGRSGIRCLEQAALLDPKDPRPHATLGRVHHDLGDLDASAAAYERALRLDPGDAEVRRRLVAGLLEVNKTEQAGPHLDRALADAPDDPKLLGLAARLAEAEGRDEDAESLAARALERDPSNADALMIRVNAARRDGRLAEALTDLERLVRLQPNDLSVLQKLAQVEARLGLSERAAQSAERHRQAMERATGMDRLAQEITARPDDPEPRWRMGVYAEQGEQWDLARNCYQAALDLDPNYAQAAEGLRRLSLRPAKPPAIP